MQATVFSFDPEHTRGTVVTDAGVVIAFGGDAFRAGGVRLLRTGQRVRLTRSADGQVSALTVVTLELPADAEGDPA